MGSFADADFASAFSEVADTITVTRTPRGGAEVTLAVAIWNEDATLPEYFDSDAQVNRRGVLTVDPAEVLNPHVEDAYTINGVPFACTQVGDRVPLLDLQLESREQREVVNEQHRVRR